jgi:pyridoxal 5'-phosphate synthase pdxT subunit
VSPLVGVLALQGDFEEHIASLRRLGADTREIRTEAQLAEVDSLIVPGGESTSMAKLMDIYGLREPLQAFARSGKPVWGTCAGLILLAGRLEEHRPEPLGLMDTVVQRNGFGRQVDSFETDLDITGVDGGAYHAFFIRAPKIVEAGPGVEVIAALEDGTIVAARERNLLVTAFHPELTTDDRVHGYFLAMAAEVAAR